MVNIAVTLYITVPHFHVLLYRGLDAVMAPKPAPAPGAAPASKKPRGKKPKSRSNSRNTTPQGSPEHKARRQEEPIEPITIPAPRTDAGKKKRGNAKDALPFVFLVACAGVLGILLLGFGERSWTAALPPVSALVPHQRYITYCHEYGYEAWRDIGFGNAVVSLINMLHLSRQLGRTLLLPAHGFCYVRFDLRVF